MRRWVAGAAVREVVDESLLPPFFTAKRMNAFDDKHSTCLGCGQLMLNSELNSGKCYPCEIKNLKAREIILAKADGQTLAKLARELTASLKATNKGEPTSPKILDAALYKLGAHYRRPGAEALGELISDQLLKATGQNLTPIEREDWKHSPLVIHRFAELLTRLSVKNDERQSLDVSSLSEDDLLSSLTTLVMDMIGNNAEYRRMAVMEGIRKQSDLIHEAMTIAGMPIVESKKILVMPEAIAKEVDDFNAEADDGD